MRGRPVSCENDYAILSSDRESILDRAPREVDRGVVPGLSRFFEK